MDTRYDVISSRWSSHFWVKMNVFQLLSGIKEKRLDKIMQSNYLCVVLLVKRIKLLIVTVFTCFLFLEKIQDGDHVWWRHRPPAVPPRIKYTSSCREGQKRSTEGKIEIRGRGSINPNLCPPPYCSTVRVWLCVYVRGLSRHITANGEKFGMGLLITKINCYSSCMRGAGVSTQQFSSLQGNKILFQTKYALWYDSYQKMHC